MLSNFGFNFDPRSNTMFVPFFALLDTSYSMYTSVGGTVTRYQAAVSSLIKALRSLAQDDLLVDNVHLFLYTFGNREVHCICDGVALCNLDIDNLERELFAIQCNGGTPMGAALEEALERMIQVKEEARRRGENYKQPLMCIVSDGEPTDKMQKALMRVDELQKTQKMVLLPFAIGEPDQKFPLFEQMVACQGDDLKILTTESDIRKHFKLIDKTIGPDEIPVVPLSKFGCLPDA